MTYRPEEEEPTTEDGKALAEEEEPSVPVDDVIPNSEITAAPPLPSENNFDTGDLLVSILISDLSFLFCFCNIYLILVLVAGVE